MAYLKNKWRIIYKMLRSSYVFHSCCILFTCPTSAGNLVCTFFYPPSIISWSAPYFSYCPFSFYCPLAFRAILEHIPKSGLSMIRKTAIVYVCSNKQVFMCSFQLSVLWSIVEHVDNIIKIPNHIIRLYQQLRSTIDSFVYVIILVAIHFTYIHTYIHNSSLQTFSQDYWPSFSHHLCCMC